MKRVFYLLVVALMLPIVMSAEKVSEQDALRMAQQFMKGKNFSLPSLSRGVGGDLSKAESRGFYVFNAEDTGGFVLVSADDRAPAVLGYSDKGKLDLDHVPANLQWLLDCYEKSITSLSEGGQPQRARSAVPSDRTSIAPLIETEWGQQSPYNDLCPVYKGESCYTGCMATAMAQLMNYHKWPKGETTAIPAYRTYSLRISMPELPPTTFNWNALTDEDIARLHLYCGQSVEMDYTPSASGGAVGSKPFVTYFDYDKKTRTVNHSDYSEEAWMDILYQELKEKRPVLYRGNGSDNPGHAFICDGYDADNDMFHLNLGWSGSGNGYYILSYISTVAGNFSDDQTAVIGIQPNKGGEIELPALAVVSITAGNTTVNRSSSSSDFTISMPKVVVRNILPEDVTCDIAFRLYKNTTPVLDVMGILTTGNLPAGYSVWNTSGNLTFGTGLSNGTYRLVPVHRFSGTSADFVPDDFSDRKYIEVVINGNTMTLTVKDELIETAFDYDYDGVKYHVSLPSRNASAIGLATNSPAVNVKFQSFSISGSEILKALGKPSASELTVEGERIMSSSTYQFTVTSVVGDFSDSDIKSVAMDNTVTRLGASTSFLHCTSLKSMQLSEAITEIPDYCFYGCESLESVNLPSGLTRIGESAFAESYSLESISIPDNVKTIGDNAFDWCSSLSEITITPQSQLESIGAQAFQGCIFTTVTLPASLKSIGDQAFWVEGGALEVHSLIQTPFETYSFWGSYEDVLYVPVGTKSKYEATSCWNQFGTIIEEEGSGPGPEPSKNIVFADAEVKRICVEKWDTDKDGELSEAEAAAVKGVTGFANNQTIKTFSEFQYFTGITLVGRPSQKFVYIDEPGFSGCSNLTSITIPNSVTTIAYNAFKNCSSLSFIDIPNSVTDIRMYAFDNCRSLKSVSIGNSVTNIEASAFSNCSSLTSVTIPNSVTKIGYDPNSAIGPGVVFVGGNIFPGCSNLTTIKVEDGNTVYDSRDNSNAIIHTSTNTMIVGCKNTTIPNSVCRIGNNAFKNCSGLISVTIPNSVTSIGKSAFSGCSSLKEVKSMIEEPFAIDASVFQYNDNGNYKFTDATLYVPKGTKAKYEATDGWKNFTTIIEMGSEPSTPGDLNGDGSVDVGDIMAIINIMASGSNDLKGDINGDGNVDVGDIMAIIIIMAGN